jgi:hypothetical protein
MAGNAYLRLARLGTHPAFSMRDGQLHCPFRACDGLAFQRVSEYTSHLLKHDLTEERAQRWLDWRAYDKLARSRGWKRFETGGGEG